MNWIVPLSDLDFGPEESAAVQQVLDSRWLTMGAVTQQFEQEFAAYLGARHAIGVSNCTAALHLSCVAAGLEPGDEAIVPSLTFVATANAIRYTGATPVFADIASADDLCISVDAIARSITERTKAILVVHYGGYACDMPAIMALAEQHGLIVIEDNAHSPGGAMDGRSLGTWGQSGCFSFFSNKNLATGEGGMVVTNDDAFAEKLRIIRSHGMTTLTWDRHQGRALSYDVVALGFNYRIDEIRSAIGRVQLAKLDRNNAHRRQLVDLYRSLLVELAPELEVPFREHRGLSAAHLMPILLPKDIDRFAFMEHMKAHGIQTSIHFPPIHKFQAYQQNGFGNAHLPVTEDVSSRVVTLPLFSSMKEEQVHLVAQAIQTSLHEAPR